MSDINFTLDKDNLAELLPALESLGPQAEKAAYRSINKTLASLRSRVTKGVRQTYNITTGRIQKGISIHKATTASLRGELSLHGRSISLYQFRPTPAYGNSRKPAEGLTVEVKKGEKKVYPGTFYGQINGKPLVLARLTKARHPLEIQTGPSVPEMLEDTSIVERAKLDMEQLFYANFRHEVTVGYKYSGNLK